MVPDPWATGTTTLGGQVAVRRVHEDMELWTQTDRPAYLCEVWTPNQGAPGAASSCGKRVNAARDRVASLTPGAHMNVPPVVTVGSQINDQNNKFGHNVDHSYRHAQEYTERHAGYLQNLEAQLMAGDQ